MPMMGFSVRFFLIRMYVCMYQFNSTRRAALARMMRSCSLFVIAGAGDERTEGKGAGRWQGWGEVGNLKCKNGEG